MQTRWLTEVEQRTYYIREFAFASCLAAQKQSDIRMCNPSGKICTLCKFNQQNINFYKVAFCQRNLNVILVLHLTFIAEVSRIQTCGLNMSSVMENCTQYSLAWVLLPFVHVVF